ncbi:MAG: transporter substrate-binding domain-containing protein [Spirochaetales bacterium]|nr:transporter substrate-binding domain-containing protein [Spirochaetales bacterium]
MMWKAKLYYLSILFFIIQVFSLFSDSSSLLISSLDFPPITDMTLENYGFITDLFNAIFEPYGYEVEIRVYPWARAFEMSKQGNPVIGIFPSIYNGERETWFYFSEAIINSAYVLVTRKDTGITAYDSLYELRDKTIGILRGGITGSELDSSDFRKEEATDFDTNLRKLLAGRFDLITGEYMSIMNNINVNFPGEKDNLVVLTPYVSKVDFHLMISKEAPHAGTLLKQCNEGIERIGEEGILRDLMEKYGIISFE